jgi:arylsulfatase A-like enzyme
MQTAERQECSPTASLPSASGSNPRESIRSLLLPAAWFGILAGLVEGAGLLAFQKINWQQWGATIHVSPPILWISPLVDLVFFLGVALAVLVASRIWPRIPAFRSAVFAFAALTLYDWLLVPRRLYHIACLLLAAGFGVVLSRWVQSHQDESLRLWRKTLPLLAALAMALFVGITGGNWLSERQAVANLPPPAPGSPNVVVIIIDTLRADHVSAYGYSRPTTPNLDRLAAQGVLFENATSATSWTFPSHVSLLTGEYPFEHGLGRVPPMHLWRSSDGLIRAPMIGEEMARRGYRTGAFSGNRVYFDHNLGFGRGFIHFDDYFFSPADAVLRTVFGEEFGRWVLRSGKVLRVLNWLGLKSLADRDVEGSGEHWAHRFWSTHSSRKRGEEVNRELLKWIGTDPGPHPFFAVLNYFDIHAPYGGPSWHPKLWKGNDVDQYDDGVKYVDDCIGQLIAALGKRGLDQNTLVVITADHGEMLGEHGLPFHGKSLYWDLIHVPLIFWYPGHIPAGVRVPDVTSTSFIPDTLSSWLPGAHAFAFPGHSLARLWDGSVHQPGTYPILAELSYNCFREDLQRQRKFAVPTDLKGAMKSIITARWHLIRHKTFGDQLYDWSKDPLESQNLINTPEGREVAGVLTGQLFDLLAGRKDDQKGIENALSLNPDGRPRRKFIRKVAAPSRINDYYLLRANAGSVIGLEVQALRSESERELDSVLTLVNARGEILQTCRNPGDDHIPPPGISDATPEAFDDTCMNDDAKPGVDSASRLELQVPGSGGEPVEIYLRVSDWNAGLVSEGPTYEITMSEMQAANGRALAGEKSVN